MGVGLLTSGEQEALIASVVRGADSTAADAEAAIRWAKACRAQQRTLEDVLAGRVGLRVRDGEVTFYDPNLRGTGK